MWIFPLWSDPSQAHFFHSKADMFQSSPYDLLDTLFTASEELADFPTFLVFAIPQSQDFTVPWRQAVWYPAPDHPD